MAEPIRLSIDLDQQRPLSQDLLGANNECVFRPVWFDHPAYAKKSIAAGPPFFRFPGGTGSNFYNSFTGFFDNHSPSTRDYGGHNKRIALFTDGAGQVPDEYLNWVKKHDVSYSLVLNVCTQTFEQNKSWIKYLGCDGHKVARIEIRNEIFHSGYKWVFTNGAEYVEWAKKITAGIRKERPETKVGVIVPTQLYQDKEFLTDDRPASMNHIHDRITALDGKTIVSTPKKTSTTSVRRKAAHKVTQQMTEMGRMGPQAVPCLGSFHPVKTLVSSVFPRQRHLS